MRRFNPGWRRTIPFLIILGLLSCVTVNIYFPAEEVRRTAEEIVGDVRQQSEKVEPQSSLFQGEGSLIGSLRGSLGVGIAYAQSETTVSNAAIRAIKARLKARDAELAPFFDQGIIGESNKGYVEILSFGKLDMKSKAAAKRLVDAENGDRRALYKEIARALNVDPSQLDRIEGIFASEWQQFARSGWYVQKANGKWIRK